MPTIYIPDEAFFAYVDHHGSVEDAREAIKEVVVGNSPGEDDDGEN